MKGIVSLLVAWTAAFALLAAGQDVAQDKTPVKVKNSEVRAGVIVVHLKTTGKPLDLQCNEGMANCKSLQGGDYLMVELPKNYGLYDCRNVEIYRAAPDKPDGAEQVGAYCLVEK